MKEFKNFLQSDQIQALSDASQSNYKYALQHFESFLLNDCECSELSQDTISNDTLSEFCKKMKAKKKSATTIKQYLTVIKLFLRFNKISVDFTYKATSHDKKKQQLKKINRWFDESDIELCLDYMFEQLTDKKLRLRNLLLVRLAIETGARIRELANINGADFDIPNNTVFLSVSKTEIRPAFYSQETADLVLKLQNSTVSFFKEDWNGPVFPAVGMCKKIITGMLSDLGLKKQNDGRGPHTFRHYAATHLYYNGDMDLNDLAIVLGDKPDTIRDNYLHPTPAMLRRRVEKAWGWNPAN